MMKGMNFYLPSKATTLTFLSFFYSPLLYVTFWSLSMYDLYTPVERYEEEVTKLKDAINDVDDNKEIVRLLTSL